MVLIIADDPVAREVYGELFARGHGSSWPPARARRLRLARDRRVTIVVLAVPSGAAQLRHKLHALRPMLRVHVTGLMALPFDVMSSMPRQRCTDERARDRQSRAARSISIRRSARTNGFNRTPSAPTSAAISGAYATAEQMSTRGRDGSMFSFAATIGPDTRGSFKSSTITSGFNASSSRSAASPSEAMTTSYTRLAGSSRPAA
jgi:hypothetical protein